MAGRKDKNTVDYFPHFCISGKTIFILENQFGHIGYYVWFKTLELLGINENHYIDLRNDTDLLFLISKMKITEQQLNDIYNLLAKLNAIDSEMWNEKVIYSENFVKNISDVYKRRNKDVYGKEYLCKHILNLCLHKSKKGKHKTTKESIVNESIVNKIYSLYPSKCPIKKSGTGKTKNNKDKIKKLLQIHSAKDLELTINSYIEDCKNSDRYIKNFSTFLNNLPEPEPEQIKVKKEFITYYRQGIADRTCPIDEWEGIQKMYGIQITGFKKTIKEVLV